MDPVQLLIELGVIPGPSGAGPMPGRATAAMPGALPGVQGDPEPAPPAFPPGGYAPSMSQAPPALGPPNQSSFDRNRGAYPYPVGQGPGSLIPPGAGGAVPTTGGNLAPPGVDGSDPYAMLAQILEPSMGPQGAEPSRQGGYAPPEGDPSRQGGYGAGAPAQGGQGPAAGPSGGTPTQGQPPAAVPGTPTPASPTTSPTGASTGAGQSALSAPDSRNRLFQMLSIMGAVLAQPAPPGGNTMSQVAKALAMGNLYNDSMNRADQERGDVRVKQELDNRRVTAEETQVRQGNRRLDISQQGQNSESALQAARVRQLDADIKLMPFSAAKAQAEATLAQIHALGAGPEAAAKIELLREQVRLAGAHVEQITAATGTPEERVRAKAMDTIKPYMGDGSPGSMNVPGMVMALGANARALGLRDLTPKEDSQARQAYDALRKRGMSAAEADQAIISAAWQQGLRPKQYSLGEKR